MRAAILRNAHIFIAGDGCLQIDQSSNFAAAVVNKPHGAVREIWYFSKVTGSWRHAVLYLPPGYDTETKMLAGEKNLPRAARKVLAMGPNALVVKHGEYGATIFFREGAFGVGSHPFRAPALPIDEVKDPTGAGDSFAGGFMGYIASQGEVNREILKRALFYGGVMGSFAVERFGTERLQAVTREEIDERFNLFREISHLDHTAA